MNLYRRCGCKGACRHAWWYRFRFEGRELRGSTHTANKTLAGQVAAKRRTETLTGDQDIRRTPAPKLSAHIEAYDHNEKKRFTLGTTDDGGARIDAASAEDGV